jgi:uncharacterized protein (TIGR02145 family)
MKMKNRFLIYLLMIGFAIVLTLSCKKKDDNKDDTPTPPIITQGPNVTDIDGNVYHSVVIGTQTWMTENLKVTHYRNGDSIPNITDSTTWCNLTSVAYCDYNNTPGNSVTYGRLYNWYTVVDSRNLAPIGWHVPSNAEWDTLQYFLIRNGYGNKGSGGPYIAKSMATTSGWYTSFAPGTTGCNQDSNNRSGFTALPSGIRSFNGSFNSITILTFWWSITEYNTWMAPTNELITDYSYFTSDCLNKNSGLSVRCVKD